MEGDEGVTSPESRSRELLGVGSGSGGIYSKLLINAKHGDKNGAAPAIVRMPRSSILNRIQNFLPQMAEANESLSKQMETMPAGAFDIENTDEEEKIIEMNVAVVELSDTDSSEAESSSDGSSDSDLEGEVTEDNIKLRKETKKGKIEVLEQ
ncbi:NOP protein chaperone 1 [Spea bombifrons]|uniref:NOP protein chaperone 1 n=1 Tax=Spea bombifrons TaxID=233779 RepID=UPI00234B4A50|nr:NOP protein chaperone 1 [Spea bombifrons]